MNREVIIPTSLAKATESPNMSCKYGVYNFMSGFCYLGNVFHMFEKHYTLFCPPLFLQWNTGSDARCCSAAHLKALSKRPALFYRYLPHVRRTVSPSSKTGTEKILTEPWKKSDQTICLLTNWLQERKLPSSACSVHDSQRWCWVLDLQEYASIFFLLPYKWALRLLMPLPTSSMPSVLLWMLPVYSEMLEGALAASSVEAPLLQLCTKKPRGGVNTDR